MKVRNRSVTLIHFGRLLEFYTNDFPVQSLKGKIISFVRHLHLPHHDAGPTSDNRFSGEL